MRDTQSINLSLTLIVTMSSLEARLLKLWVMCESSSPRLRYVNRGQDLFTYGNIALRVEAIVDLALEFKPLRLEPMQV